MHRLVITLRAIPVAALLGLAAVTSASAAQRIVVEGFVERAVLPYDPSADFTVRADPGARVQFGIADPAGRLSTLLPARLRCTVELTSTRFPDDVPLVTLLAVGETTILGSDSCRRDPGRWAGCDNGLYASIDEPLPRILTSTGIAEPDADGDGVPDSRDDFPDDPSETTDTDGDGVGNNADNDDDGDGMLDPYETQNGLNRLVNDAALDLDRDGRINGDEFVADTRANDALSYLDVSEIEVIAPGTVRISWLARASRVYAIRSGGTLDASFELVAGKEAIIVTGDGLHSEEITGASDLFFQLEARLPSTSP